MLEGHLLGEHQLTAQMAVFLQQGDLVAPLGGGDGGLHARRAAANDHHMLGLACLLRGDHFQKLLPAHGGVYRAGEGRSTVVVQTMEATDAGNDIVLPALIELVGPLGVGDQAPGHGHHVRLALGQGLLDEVRILESTQGENRNLDPGIGLDGGGEFGVAAVGEKLSGMGDIFSTVVKCAGGDMGDVDPVLEVLDHLDAVLHVIAPAIGPQLVAGNAVLDEQLAAHPLPDGIEDHVSKRMRFSRHWGPNSSSRLLMTGE